MRLTIVPPERVWQSLDAALGGAGVVAPVRPGDRRALAMLRPDEPVPEPDAALIVVTSGSTGAPKGVVLSREALAAAAAAASDRLGGPGTWTCALPVHHVAGVMTLVRSWYAGTTPVFAPGELPGRPPGPGRAYLSLVPTQLHRALAVPALAERLAGYDAVLVGGAALAPQLRAAASEAGLSLVRTYGLSETCGGCVYDGVPLAGVAVTLDGGRITIGGACVFSGYRLRPELTARVLTRTAAGRRLRTSDRGEWARGRLRVLGRVDDVVVSGGVNVDLAAAQREASAVYGEPTAGGLVLVGIPDAEWGCRVVAVTTGPHTTDEVRSALSRTLEAAALPREVRRVDSIPLTAGGKIDSQAVIEGWR